MDQETLDAVGETMRRFYRDHQPFDQRVMNYQQGHKEGANTWEDMALLGWLGLSLPVHLEGFGASVRSCLSLIRVAGREARPESLSEHWLLAPFLLKHAEEALAPALAASLSTGTRRLGLLEPQASLTVQANELLSGRGLLIGTEVAVTDWLVPVRVGGDLRLAQLSRDADGVDVQPGRLLDGRESRWVSFNQTPLQWIGSAGEGIGQRALDLVAAGQVADSVGAFESAFELTLDYLKQRTQFGQALSRLQAVQHLMADVFCDLQQSISLMHRLGHELDSDLVNAAPMVAASKSFIGRRMLRGVGRLIQLSGGIAMTEEYKLGHLYRRLQVAATVYGDAEQQLSRIDPRSLLMSA
ncbi:acyl-CoA dehydrogenase family protein [Pseudomonas sp. NPDC086251]|uniref:acyl-CoA dehydrogenase family protein n=1 Tax=Pseudomonas sp. NPDC086251 TaxID=3364431 RepID=UPI00383829CB